MNKKVLYINNYYDGTGYSQAGIDRILAMDTAGIDVVPRSLKLNNSVHLPPQRLLELESKNHKNCDIVIQHTLPSYMVYNKEAGYNIGFFESETTYNSNDWGEKLSYMDEIWCSNEEQKQIASKYNNNCHVIPTAVNIDKFNQKRTKLPHKELSNKFVFYTIGEFNHRKNFGALVKAFHNEFDKDEQVALLIKSNISGRNEYESNEIIKKFCNDIKLGLKKYKNISSYHNELVCTERLEESELLDLHYSCNCFVSSSHGESICLPAIDALGIGNPVVASNCGGFQMIKSILVDGKIESCFGAIDSFHDLYTSKDKWFNIDIDDLSYKMRYIYDMSQNNKNMLKLKEQCANSIEKFSYENVGNIILNRLKEI